MILHPRARYAKRVQLSAIRNWAFWSLPASSRLYLATLEFAVAALTITLLFREPLTSQAALHGGILLALALGYAEVSKRFERMRRYVGDGKLVSRPNPIGVWGFAALLVLPAGWAAAVYAILFGHAFVHRRRERTGQPYRQAFTAAAVMLAQLAAAVCLVGLDPGSILTGSLVASLLVIAAAAVFTAVNLAALLSGIWLASRPPSVRVLLPSRDAVCYELACLACGLAAAELLLRDSWLVVAMLAPVAYLHRNSMLRTLHRASRTDAKTELLNSAAWTEHAESVLARRGEAAVLIIDVDHFKLVNDQHGHLVGDRVLVEVARALQITLRGNDNLGRFGGDEFVVLLDGVGPDNARQVGDRLRAAIAAIRVGSVSPSASVGLAHSHEHGTNLTTLLAAADRALYEAKGAGRDRLCVAAATC